MVPSPVDSTGLGSLHFSVKASLNIYFTFHLYYLGVHLLIYSAECIAASKSNS